jgi:hypothetical protein
MKTKLPRKKDVEKEDQEQPKGFEEFSIDPAVLLELDELEETDENLETQENTETHLEDEIQVLDIEDKKEIVDASSSEFINIVRDNINLCAKEIKEISETMQQIEGQKNSESFWRKGENIKTISRNVNKMSEVQQKTLDLLVMFLGASGKMADDYDTILKTIDELGEVNGGEVEVLNYLLKIKKMVKEIKNNDERLKSIMCDVKTLQRKMSEMEKVYKDKVSTYEKTSKITLSRINRFKAKTNRMSFFILISYALLIVFGIIFYIKVMK